MRFAGRDRAPHARGGAARTSSSSTACRCSTWSTAAATGTKSCSWRKAIEAAGATHHQHRHRLARSAHPDHRHLGAARRVRLGHRASCRPQVRAAAGRHQPHQHAGRRRSASSPRGDADMVSMARPLLADPEFVEQGARRPRATRSTPASPATRPAWTTSSRTSAPAAWSIRAPATRPSWSIAPTPTPQAHRRRRRRSRRAWPARPSPPSAAIASRCSTPPTRSAASSTSPSASRARKNSHETLRYFRHRIERHRRRRAARHARRRRLRLRRLRRVVLATGVAAARASIPRRRPRQGRRLPRRARRPRAGGRARRDHRRRRHRLRRRRIPRARRPPRPRSDPPRWMAEWGVDPTTSKRAAAWHAAAARSRRRARSGCCSARPASPARAWARPPAGSTAPRSRPRACRCWAASNTSASTTPACTSASTASEQLLPVDHVVVCAGQEPRRDCSRRCRPTARGPRHRRRRRRRRARRQARHRPGHRASRRSFNAPRRSAPRPVPPRSAAHVRRWLRPGRSRSEPRRLPQDGPQGRQGLDGVRRAGVHGVRSQIPECNPALSRISSNQLTIRVQRRLSSRYRAPTSRQPLVAGAGASTQSRGFRARAKAAAEPPPSPVRHAGSRRRRRPSEDGRQSCGPAQRSKESP